MHQYSSTAYIVVLFFVFLILLLWLGFSRRCSPAAAASSLALVTYGRTSQLPVGVTPNGIVVTPCGRYAYVANNNNYKIAGEDSVTVLDLSAQRTVTTIHDASFKEPFTVTLNRLGTRAYVTNSSSTTVSVIDTKLNTVIAVIDGFNGPSGMAVNAAGTLGYVINYGPLGFWVGTGRTATVVDLVTNTVLFPEIDVGPAPSDIALSPDGRTLYVTNSIDGKDGNGTLSYIDVETNTITKVVAGFFGPFTIAVSACGSFALVTNFGSNSFAAFGTTVSRVDLRLGVISHTFTVGIQPSGVAISRDGRRAFVSNYNELYANVDKDLVPGVGTVSVLDLVQNVVLGPPITVGRTPAALIVTPDGSKLLSTNYTDNSVTLINL